MKLNNVISIVDKLLDTPTADFAVNRKLAVWGAKYKKAIELFQTQRQALIKSLEQEKARIATISDDDVEKKKLIEAAELATHEEFTKLLADYEVDIERLPIECVAHLTLSKQVGNKIEEVPLTPKSIIELVEIGLCDELV